MGRGGVGDHNSWPVPRSDIVTLRLGTVPSSIKYCHSHKDAVNNVDNTCRLEVGAATATRLLRIPEQVRRSASLKYVLLPLRSGLVLYAATRRHQRYEVEREEGVADQQGGDQHFCIPEGEWYLQTGLPVSPSLA